MNPLPAPGLGENAYDTWNQVSNGHSAYNEAETATKV
jgi:hypothetical protein